jgi:cell wall assembly regulator SMI1
MSKLQILGGEEKLTNEDIKEFEKNYGLQLPENYKKLLLKHNGGYISEYHEQLSSFQSVKYGQCKLEDAINAYSTYETLLDKEFVPIASSHSNNPITLCLRQGELYGKIILFFFDRDEEPELLAESLEELLGVESIDDL